MGRLEIHPDRLPIAIAAGLIKTEADIERIAQDEIIALATIGTLTGAKRVILDQEFSWDAQTRKARNRIEFDNPGLLEEGPKYLPRCFKLLKEAGIIAVLSVGPEEREDPLKVLPELGARAVDLGADHVEFNLSCPNVKPDRKIDIYNLSQMEELTGQGRESLGKDVKFLVKVGNMPRPLISAYAEARFPIDGWTVMNSHRGFSGPGLNTLFRLNTIDWVNELRHTGQEDVSVISVGGVSGDRQGGHEVYGRVHNIGATVVGVAQAAYRAQDLRGMFVDMAQGYVEAAQGANSQSNP